MSISKQASNQFDTKLGDKSSHSIEKESANFKIRQKSSSKFFDNTDLQIKIDKRIQKPLSIHTKFSKKESTNNYSSMKANFHLKTFYKNNQMNKTTSSAMKKIHLLNNDSSKDLYRIEEHYGVLNEPKSV